MLNQRLQCVEISSPTQTRYPSTADRRDHRRMMKLFVRMLIGKTHFNNWPIGRRQSSAQAHTAISKRAGINNDANGILCLLLQEIDQRPLVIRLEDFDLIAQVSPTHTKLVIY